MEPMQLPRDGRTTEWVVAAVVAIAAILVFLLITLIRSSVAR